MSSLLTKKAEPSAALKSLLSIPANTYAEKPELISLKDLPAANTLAQAQVANLMKENKDALVNAVPPVPVAAPKVKSPFYQPVVDAASSAAKATSDYAEDAWNKGKKLVGDGVEKGKGLAKLLGNKIFDLVHSGEINDYGRGRLGLERGSLEDILRNFMVHKDDSTATGLAFNKDWYKSPYLYGAGALGLAGLIAAISKGDDKKKKKEETQKQASVEKKSEPNELYFNQPTQYPNRFKGRVLTSILGGLGGGALGTLAGGVIANAADAKAENVLISALLGGALGTGLGGWGGKALADKIADSATNTAVEDEIKREQIRQQLRQLALITK